MLAPSSSLVNKGISFLFKPSTKERLEDLLVGFNSCG
uniref:Uncharacterized protein n=1 Tax=Utricularia reniformis TaxID=192314 RepID=A0A1Y0B309_9LAMI|nr:hypothetical protein AEK19_MT1606 [Utricularia reniformis]ART31791.1 hypothetical protein AEK19_MT1606 [Utricularia reniformis]